VTTKRELEDFAAWGLSESRDGFVTQEMAQRRDGPWFVSLRELPRG